MTYTASKAPVRKQLITHYADGSSAIEDFYTHVNGLHKTATELEVENAKLHQFAYAIARSVGLAVDTDLNEIASVVSQSVSAEGARTFKGGQLVVVRELAEALGYITAQTATLDALPVFLQDVKRHREKQEGISIEDRKKLQAIINRLDTQSDDLCELYSDLRDLEDDID